jgi:hypothetical protein
MVQAWPMSFHVPSAGVLGPRPGAPPQQAYIAGLTHHHPSAPIPAPASSSSDVWNQQALLAALATTSVPANGPQASEWFLDMGATSHMASGSDTFPSARPLPHSAPIIVGNDASMAVTHAAHSSIPGTPFRLHNVLISLDLVKNLISIRSFTRDNNVSVKFDPLRFSIKDLPTPREMLRCNNDGVVSPLALVRAGIAVQLYLH